MGINVIDVLNARTIEKGITDPDLVMAMAKQLFEETKDNALLPYMHKVLTIKGLWKLKKASYLDGPYKGKRIFSTRDSTKYAVDVLKLQGFDFKYPNNLDFVHNMLKAKNFTKYSEFKQAILARSPELFCSYAQRQIDAMLEYGHLSTNKSEE